MQKKPHGRYTDGFFMQLPGSGSAAALHNRSERKWLHSRREAAGERNEQKLTAVFRLTITISRLLFSSPSVRLGPHQCGWTHAFSEGQRTLILQGGFVPPVWNLIFSRTRLWD